MQKYKYFKIEDFNCQETGENEMDIEFIKGLDNLRAACGFPFVITSGFRSKEHSIEAAKVAAGKKLGTHAQGIASDIRVSGGSQRAKIVKHASAMGMSVGVAKTSALSFVYQRVQMFWLHERQSRCVGVTNLIDRGGYVILVGNLHYSGQSCFC